MEKPFPRIILIASTMFLLMAGCARRAALNSSPPAPPPAELRASAPTVRQEPNLPPERPAGSCKSVNGFPDPACTPGETDPKVTQNNIQSTICVSGYTALVRPSTAYTDALKVQQIREYGYSDTNAADYEEDHFVPLEIGGNPTDPRNLWPELGPSPNPKDRVEDELRRLVCSNKMTLADARQRIRSNWKTAAK
jgi:hypothetical protein